MFESLPESEITARIDRLKTAMDGAGLSSALITHKPDLFYFSGTAQDAYLWVRPGHDPLLLVKRYLPRARVESPLGQIIPLGSIREIPDRIRDIQGGLPENLGLACDVVPVRDYQFFQTLFPGVGLKDVTPAIQACRSCKSPWELARMEEVAAISSQIFNFMAAEIRPGESESAFCGRVEAYARTLGHSGRIQMRHYRSEGFFAHLMAGASGGLPGALDSPVCGTGPCIAYPYGAGPRIIRENEPVLMDLATMVHGYHMDESRMLLLGRVDDVAVDAGEKCIDILHLIRERMAPGLPLGQVFEAAMDQASVLGLEDSFLGLPGMKSRFVGHGIGVELVENPMLAPGRDQCLEPGMVFAVEPKCIFPDQYAAGIESVIQVTETGSRFLSKTENTLFRI
ncbi:MAG: Xaa-Pro peptidase family protein [Desulfobacterales bacterium]|nr:Xaa-Pro peptidase family protein [Desulfobacterales bacterium]